MEPWPVTKEYRARAFYFYWIPTDGLFIGLFRVGSADNIKPFQVGKGRSIALIFTAIMMYPIVMSFFSPPTYHYANMPRLADEFIEALVPPPPTEDEIAIKEGWFVMNMMKHWKLQKKKESLFLLILQVFIVLTVALWNVEFFQQNLFKNNLIR